MTIFSKIIAGEIPSHKIAENDKFYAFLDINPVALGHTLVVPKQEVDYIFDLSDEDLAAMNVFAKKVAHAIKNSNAMYKDWRYRYWFRSSTRTHSSCSYEL